MRLRVLSILINVLISIRALLGELLDQILPPIRVFLLQSETYLLALKRHDLAVIPPADLALMLRAVVAKLVRAMV
jgi:hypothetical protein